jgi:hypothetical protein
MSITDYYSIWQNFGKLEPVQGIWKSWIILVEKMLEKYVNVFKKSKKDDVWPTKKFNNGTQNTLLKTSNLN